MTEDQKFCLECGEPLPAMAKNEWTWGGPDQRLYCSKVCKDRHSNRKRTKAMNRARYLKLTPEQRERYTANRRKAREQNKAGTFTES